MYCAYCGKENDDAMLFCGYCGKPLVTPDHDDEKRNEESRALYGRPDAEPAAEEPVRRADTIVPVDEEIRKPREPVRDDSDWDAGTDWDDEDDWETSPEDPFALDDDPEFSDTPAPFREEEPVRAPKQEPRPPVLNRHEAVNARGGGAKTLVPRRESDWNADDIFMEEREEREAEYEERSARRRAARKRSYEEAEHGNFFVRHIRGFITMFLLLMVAAVIAMWAWSGSGQRVLAQLGVSRQPASYVRLANEVAALGSHEMEGYYYMRALSLDDDNLDYAIRAANAYVAAGNTAKATEALKAVIALQPDNADAYVLLSSLYPVVNTRPQEIRQIIQQGYELTGDSRLSQ